VCIALSALAALASARLLASRTATY